MKKAEEKQKYEPVLLELVSFGTLDIVTTSVFDEENVDPDAWTQNSKIALSKKWLQNLKL